MSINTLVEGRKTKMPGKEQQRTEQARQQDGSRRLQVVMFTCFELLLLLNFLMCTGSEFHTFSSWIVLWKWHCEPVPVKFWSVYQLVKKKSNLPKYTGMSGMSGHIFCGPLWTLNFDNNTVWRFWFENSAPVLLAWCFDMGGPQPPCLSLCRLNIS